MSRHLYIFLASLIKFSLVVFSCYSDSDCSPNKVYTVCISDNCHRKACSSDIDCLKNSKAVNCIDGYCDLKECNNNTDCYQNDKLYICDSQKYCALPSTCSEEFSVQKNNLCIKKACTKDSDCLTNNYYFTCNNGFCSKTLCTSNLDCNKIKSSSLCTIFTDDSGSINQACYEIKCSDQSDCAQFPNYSCNRNTFKCTYMRCSQDSDCSPYSTEYPYCSNGICVAANCSNDTFCFQNYPSNPICLNGRCSKVTCMTNADCSGYEWLTVCKSNACYPRACRQYENCDITENDLYQKTCNNKQCLPSIDSECDSPYYQREGRLCKKALCSSDLDCKDYYDAICFRKGYCIYPNLCFKHKDCFSNIGDMLCDYSSYNCYIERCFKDDDCSRQEFSRSCGFIYDDGSEKYCRLPICWGTGICPPETPICDGYTCNPASCESNQDCEVYPLIPYCDKRNCKRGFCLTHKDCAKFNQTKMCIRGRCEVSNCTNQTDCIGIEGSPFCGPEGKCIPAPCNTTRDCLGFPKYRKCGENNTCIELACSKNDDCKQLGENFLCGLVGNCVVDLLPI